MEHYKTHNEGMRQLLELAICCGRGWQSPQTGYIHYFYSQQDESYHHTIPTYENMLFVLALMRSRISENIIEAKEMLHRLLRFQSHEKGMEGNFPVYLHEYPMCKDSLWGAHILPPLYWIYRNFNHVLGPELKEATKSALVALQAYILSRIQGKLPSYPLGMKIGAAAWAVGNLFAQEVFIKQGESLYQELSKQSHQEAWNSPIALSELIIAFQMLSTSLSEGPQKEFYDHLLATWHSNIETYCGAGWKEYQWCKEPQVTFYDFYMGYITNSYSQRCFADHPIQLQGALVHPCEDQISIVSLSTCTKPEEHTGVIHGLPWKVVKYPDVSFSLIAKDNAIYEVQDKTFNLLKILWKSAQRLRSFVCQGENIEKIDFNVIENQIELYFFLSEPLEGDSKDREDEIGFYLDYHEETKIAIEKEAATTFRLDEKIILSDERIKITLSFSLHEGSGTFLGHLMKGNRPCQRATIGTNRFAAYDWHVFLRTIERSDICTIKATLRL